MTRSRIEPVKGWDSSFLYLYIMPLVKGKDRIHLQVRQRRVAPLTLSTLLLIFALLSLLCSGCIDEKHSPLIGTWEWSDGKGYTQRYTFDADHSFHAEALGLAFEGTWEEISPGHFEVTYWNQNDATKSEKFHDSLIYDEKTDRIYLPGHERVG